MEFAVKDDEGLLGTVQVDSFESITEAHIAALEILIDWFESDDAEDTYDASHNAQCIKECEARQNDIRNFVIDETDIIEISGFEIVYQESVNETRDFVLGKRNQSTTA